MIHLTNTIANRTRIHGFALRCNILSFVKRFANHYIRGWEEFVNHFRSFGRSGRRLTLRPMAYTPQHIANYFIDRADADGFVLSPLKLIKLTYIAYGWYLALKSEKLFFEKIEAWQHGPVIPSIYHEFKHYGSQPIDDHAYIVDLDADSGIVSCYAPKIDSDDADTAFILSRVWGSYKSFSGWQLRDKTHETGSPWSKVYREGVRGIALEDDHISEHYTTKIRGYISAANAGQSANAS